MLTIGAISILVVVAVLFFYWIKTKKAPLAVPPTETPSPAEDPRVTKLRKRGHTDAEIARYIRRNIRTKTPPART